MQESNISEDRLHIEYIDKANEAYLKEEKNDFEKYRLIK